MLKKMLKQYIYDFNSYVYDWVRIYDLDFLKNIDFIECNSIVKMIKNDYEHRYKDFDEDLPFKDAISYTIENSFINKIEIQLECHNDDNYINIPCKIINIIWDDNCSKINCVQIKQLEIHPFVCNFTNFRYSLMIAYYEYLKKVNHKHIFVKFVEYINEIDFNIDLSIFNSYEPDVCVNDFINNYLEFIKEPKEINEDTFYRANEFYHKLLERFHNSDYSKGVLIDYFM